MTRKPAGRILDAAGRCIVRRGNTQFRMGEVSDEAGVSRSTVYRYFPGRDDVLLGLMLMRVDHALGDLVRSLHRSGRPGSVRARDGPGPCRVSARQSTERSVVRRREHRCGHGPREGFRSHRGVAVAALRTVARSVETGGPSLRRSRSPGRSSSGCTRPPCSCWRPRGGTDRRPTNANSSSSLWCVPWCHRSDNNLILSDVQTFGYFRLTAHCADRGALACEPPRATGIPEQNGLI